MNICTCKSIFMSHLCTIYHQNKRLETNRSNTNTQKQLQKQFHLYRHKRQFKIMGKKKASKPINKDTVYYTSHINDLVLSVSQTHKTSHPLPHLYKVSMQLIKCLSQQLMHWETFKEELMYIHTWPYNSCI